MSFLDSFSSLFAKKEQSVLGIDIGSSSVKVVEIKKKRGRAVLKTYGELALGPYASTEVGRATNLPPDRIAEALRDILRESKTTTNACGTALPLSSSLISFITIPAVPDKQLADVIMIEARKYIPVPMTEVMLDWSVIPREDSYSNENEEDDETAPRSDGKDSKDQQRNPMDIKSPKVPQEDVLVVAIHNEFISNYQQIMTTSQLSPTFYEIEIFSAIRAVVEQGVAAVMIIDMGARSTKLYIVERGILRTAHIINKGGQDITLAISQSLSLSVADAENMKRLYGLRGGPEHKDLADIIMTNLDYVFYESNAALLNYQKKYGKNIAKVILTGGGVLLKGFADIAKTSFQTDIVYANPFGKMETPAFFEQQLRDAGPEFAVAIGVALRRLSETQ